jgi:hypothetical protein
MKIKSMASNSNKYGNCELCKKFVDEVYFLSFERGGDIFGHKKCLLEFSKNRSLLEKSLKDQTVLDNGGK